MCYKDLIIEDNYINGEIQDIIDYLLRETQYQIVNNFLNEDTENLAHNMIMVGEIIRDLYDYSFEVRSSKRVSIRYNPMGSWYIDKEDNE